MTRSVAPTLLLPVLGWVAQLVHYHATYQKAAQRDFRPHLSEGPKIALIVGHLVLGVMLTGIFAAVLIPNLLAARQAAQRQAEQSVAQQMYVNVVAAQATGEKLTSECPTPKYDSNLIKITACEVGLTDPQNPTLDVTFESGRSIHLP